MSDSQFARQMLAGAIMGVPEAAVGLAGLPRLVRRLRGEEVPDDTPMAAAERTVQGWSDAVANTLGIEEANPTLTSQPLQAFGRIIGGAAPVPANFPRIFQRVAPTSTVARMADAAAEIVSPLSFGGRFNNPARVAGTFAANTAAGTAIGAGIESGLNIPAEGGPVTVFPDGTVMVEEGERSTVRRASDTVLENPTTSGVAGAALLGAAYLGTRSRVRADAARQIAEQSDIVENLRNRDTPERGIGDIRTGDPILTGANRVQQAADSVLNEAVDSNTTLKTLVARATSTDDLLAETTRSRIERGTNDIAIQDHILAALDSGILETPNRTIVAPSFRSIVEEIQLRSRQDPTFATRVNELIAIESEMDNRNYAISRGKAPVYEVNEIIDPGTGRPVLDPNTGRPMLEYHIIPRATLWRQQDGALVHRRANLRADPNVARVADNRQALMHAVAEYLGEHKSIGWNEFHAFRRANPNFMHMLTPDDPKSALIVRRRGHHQGPEKVTDPMLADAQYISDMIRYVEKNNMRMAVVDAIEGWQRRDPNAPQIFGQRRMSTYNTSSNTPATKHPTISYRHGAVRHEIEVFNDAVRRSLIVQPQLTGSIMSEFRQKWQSATTGPIASAMLQPFAMANAIFSTGMTLATRPKGYSAGFIDAALQKMTGGKLGMRGDLTFVAGLPFSMAMDFGAVGLRLYRNALLHMLYSDSRLVKIFGRTNLENAAISASNRYANTYYFMQHQAGAGSVGTLGNADWDAGRRTPLGAVSPGYDQMRIVSDPQGAREYLSDIARRSPAGVKQAWRLWKEMWEIIGNAPQSLFFKQNLGKQAPAGTVKYEGLLRLGIATRQLVGDPAITPGVLRGFDRSNKGAIARAYGWAVEAVPFGNIGQQSIIRLARAAKENPLGTAMGVALPAGLLTLYSMSNAITLDDERMARGEEPLYVPHLLGLPDYQATRSVPLYIGGVGPDEGMLLRLDPTLSLPYTFIRELVIKLFRLEGDPRYEPLAATTQDHLTRMIEGRRTHNRNRAAWNSLVPFDQLPPALNAVAMALGFNVDSVQKVAERGGAQPIGARSMGGFEESRMRDDVIGKRLEGVLGALFSSAALTFIAALRGFKFNEDARPGSGAQGAAAEVLSRAADRQPEVQPLWGQPRNVATTDSTSERVNNIENRLRSVQANIASVNAPGTIGSGMWQHRAQFGGRQGAADPEMRTLLNELNSGFTRMQSDLIGARTRMREAMLDNERGALPPAERKQRNNSLAYQIREVNNRILNEFMQMEDRLSTRHGRRIRLDVLDPTQPITQFPLLETGVPAVSPSPTP